MNPSIKNPLLGKLNALIVFAAWACMALLIIALAYMKLAAPPGASILPLVVMLSCFVVLVVAHVVIALFVRCPQCNKPLTARGFAKPPYGDWDGATVMWFSGSVVCIHCGTRVNTRATK